MLHKLLTSFAIAFLFVFFLTTAGLKEVQGGDATITGLFAVSLTNKPTVMMYWYEPENFKPVRFEIGYSVLPITEDNWNEITKTGNAGGSAFWGYYGIVDNLNLDTTYYLAIKGYDSAGNSTAISNVVNVKTTDSVKNWNISDFNGLTDNSWWNLKPALPPGSTSQVFLAYDKIKDMLMTWGGHPWGGGYPQITEIYTYNISNLANANTWWLEDINLANTSDIPNGGCSVSSNWDEANELMVKFVQSPRQDYEYWRGENFEVYPWIYNFIEHKWYDMKSFGLREVVGYASNAPGHAYNSDDQYHIFVPAENNAFYKTMFYDAYTNKTFRMQNFDSTQLVSTRNDMGLVYDSKRKRFVVVGGSLQRVPAYNDVWEFSVVLNKWVKVEGVINSKIIPTYRADASAAVYDSLHDKIILFNIMGRDYELNDSRIILTFIYDLETKTWSRGNDMPGFASSHRLMDLNAVFSEQHNAALVLDSGNTRYDMYPGNTTKTWAYRYSSIIPSQTKPNPPQKASSETTSNSVILKWQPSGSSGITGYNIYRAQANNPWETSYSKITTLPSSATSYTDTTAIPGKIYFYYITAANSAGAESDSSLKVRSQPRVIMDGYVAVLSGQQTKVRWIPRTEDNDVAGYNIYRAETSYEVYPVNQPLNYGLELAQYTRPTIKSVYETEGSYVKINSNIVTTNDYTDTINLQDTNPDATYPYKVYAYRVKAVNKFGVESGWSPYWLTIPNPPTGIKVTQDDINHYVSWVAPQNSEGIYGYRVYAVYLALWGREELTSEVLTDTNMVVPTTRNQKYYVTAVDILNQEGIPSAGNRSFGKQYYEFGIATSFLPDATISQPYSTGLQAVNGTTPFNWQITSGTLPSGLTLNSSSGIISGMPTALGASSFTVKAADSSGKTNTKSLTLKISPAGAQDTQAPIISSIQSLNIATTSATIIWTTDENATSQIDYGLTASYGSQTALNSTMKKNHAATLSNLLSNTVYHYKVISKDAAGNTSQSTDKTFATLGLPDTVAPSAISNLSASGISQTSLTLNWTAPGDDGNAGTAKSYDIRHSASAITSANWASATQATGEPEPSIAGTSQTYTVAGLLPNTTYYFAIKTSDEVPNVSGLSNVVQANTASIVLLKYKLILKLRDESGKVVTDGKVKVYTDSEEILPEFAFDDKNDAKKLKEIEMEEGKKMNIEYLLPQKQKFAIKNFASNKNVTLNPQFIASSSMSLPHQVILRSSIIAFDDSDLAYEGAEITLSTAGAITHILRCTDWNFNAASCAENGWEIKPLADYDHSLADNLLTLKNITNFSAYLAGYSEQTPDSIVNLSASSLTTSSVNLLWTVPENAASYDIRYSTSAITEANWNSAVQIANEPIPGAASSSQSYAVTGLSPNTDYYFVIKTSDEIGNISDLSNSVTAKTLAEAPAPAPTPPSGGGGGGGGGGGSYSDTTPPAKPSNFQAIPADEQIMLKWQNPSDSDFVRVLIVRKEGSKPTSKDDGKIIYEGTGQEFTDINLNNDQTYYYAIYSYDKKPNYSQPAIISIQPKAGVTQIDTPASNCANRNYAHLYGQPGTIANEVSNCEAGTVHGNNTYVNLDKTTKSIYEKLIISRPKTMNISQDMKYAIAYFIHYGTPTTKRLGSGERAGVINSYVSAYGKLPENITDWQDVIKIANGRWPGQTSQTAENKAKQEFKKIYKREPNANNPNDSAAITVIAYGLRPVNRNLNSEKAAITIFKGIYGHNPSSANEWDMARAIGYSGAKR